MAKRSDQPRRHEGWKVTKRTVTKGNGGVSMERVERVRTAGILKKLSSAFIDEMGKIANGDEGEEEMKGKAPAEADVIKFLDKHPRPTDDQFHEWAEDQGFNVHKAEATVYRVLSDIINKGKSKGKMPSGMTAGKIRTGVAVEKEHTPSPVIARKIVADHTKELGSGYYPALLKMEKKLEKGAARLRGKTKSTAHLGTAFLAGAAGLHAMRSLARKKKDKDKDKKK